MPLTDAQPDALAQTYAYSLFELANGKGGRSAVEETQSELEDILELARQDKRFNEFLASRVLGTEDRSTSLMNIFKGRINDLTLRFLLVLNEKGRLPHLPAIAAAFDNIVQKKFGRVEVDVFTAAPMSPDELRGVRDRLGQSLGKEVIVHPYTDGSMIGGVKFRIGDQLVDGSVATRLRKLRDQLAVEGSAKLRSRIDRLID